jgi:hypothetical protein
MWSSQADKLSFRSRKRNFHVGPIQAISLCRVEVGKHSFGFGPSGEETNVDFELVSVASGSIEESVWAAIISAADASSTNL